jgi:hypothetical protein
MKKLSKLLFLAFLSSCQQAEFDAESGVHEPTVKTVNPTPETPENEISETKNPINPDEIFQDTPDDQAMNKCFKEWGETPFTETAAKNYRIMVAQGTGFNAPQVSDKTTSKTNNLVLIKVGVVGFSSVVLNLGNPHGWYCIVSSATGFSSLKINKHCQATIGGMQNSATGFGGSNTTEYGDGC